MNILKSSHQGLTKHFDLKIRFSEIAYTLRIIEKYYRIPRDYSPAREQHA
jgi:hypothetical protein